MALTAIQAKKLDKPGMHGDGGGLYLRITKSGSRSWMLRITVDGRRRDLGLGRFPEVSLADARKRATAHRLTVADGGDPLAEKRKAKMPTFEEAARIVFEANTARWRNGKHTRTWIQSLERHAFPVIGSMKLDRIGREDVLRVLTPIWTERPETARRVRQRIRTILRWAQAHGYVEHNAAGEGIDGALAPMPKIINGHLRALPYQEVPEAVEAIRGGRASIAAKLCIEWAILTAARSGEARGARWSEIDEDNRLWTIPGDRMKAHQEHRVPLSDAALAVLEKAKGIADGSDLVFPSPLKRGNALSDNTLMKALRSAGLAEKTTLHGFRSSFRDWAAENTGAAWAAMELSLAHSVGNSVERAYARSDLIDQRRDLMQKWATYAEGC